MNGVPSVKRLTIWIENTADFERSWDVMLSTDAKTVYPSHGRPFPKSDLARYKPKIAKIKLRKLKNPLSAAADRQATNEK